MLYAHPPKLFISAVFGIVFLLLAGCNAEKEPNVKEAAKQLASAEKPRALQFLQEMADVYKTATTYSDFGCVQIEYENSQGERLTDEIPLEIAFERPKLVRMCIADGLLVSNGRHLYAAANAVSNVALAAFGQIIEIPLEKPALSIGDLYPDRLLAESMALPFPPEILAVPPQLLLLLADDPLKTILPANTEAELLEPKQIGDAFCERILVLGNGGNRIYWIDRETKLLRRVEFPTHGIAVREGATKIHAVRAEIKDAELNPRLNRAEAFTMEEPLGAKHVRRFVPTEIALLGELPEKRDEAALIGPMGVPVSLKTLSGKIVFLLFWSSSSEPCESALKEFYRLNREWGTDEKFRFFAVNTDDSELLDQNIADAELVKYMERIGVPLSVFRPHGETLLESLRCEALPTLVMLGTNGTIQSYFRGAKTSDSVNSSIAQYTNGIQPGTKAKALFEREQRLFRQSFDEFTQSGIFAQTDKKLAAEIAPIRMPLTFQLTKLWETKELQAPGNAAALPNGFLVAFGQNNFAQIDENGKILQKTENQQRNTSFSHVRNYLSDLFIVFSPFSKNVSILDHALRQKQDFRIPEMDILDFLDIRFLGEKILLAMQKSNGDGQIRLLNPDGSTVWQFDAISMPAQIGVTDKSILALNLPDKEGTIKEIGFDGKLIREISLESGDLISWLAVDKNGICVKITEIESENVYVAGLDENGTIAWQYSHPKWRLRTPIEPILSGNIIGDGKNEWLIPCSDGTLLILDKNGKLIDEIAFGFQLHGLAVKDKTLLIIGPDSVTAWKSEPF